MYGRDGTASTAGTLQGQLGPRILGDTSSYPCLFPRDPMNDRALQVRKLVPSRETLCSLGAGARAERPTGSVNDSCSQTPCTTGPGCYAAGKG